MFDRDGVIYMVIEIGENIEIFADRTVYFAAYSFEAIIMDAPEHGGITFAPPLHMAEDGSIAFVDGLQHAHAMFTLPLDASRANPEQAAQLMAEWGFLECGTPCEEWQAARAAMLETFEGAVVRRVVRESGIEA